MIKEMNDIVNQPIMDIAGNLLEENLFERNLINLSLPQSNNNNNAETENETNSESNSNSDTNSDLDTDTDTDTDIDTNTDTFMDIDLYDNDSLNKFKYECKVDFSPYIIITDKEKLHDDTCSICYEPFIISDEMNDRIIQINCNHQYHKQCIDKWNFDKNNLNCPTCRYELNDSGKIKFITINNLPTEIPIFLDETKSYYKFFITGNCSSYGCDLCEKDISIYENTYRRKDETDLCQNCYNKNTNINNNFVLFENKFVNNCTTLDLTKYNIDEINFKTIFAKNSVLKSENINFNNSYFGNIILNNLINLTISYSHIFEPIYFNRTNLINVCLDSVAMCNINCLNEIISAISPLVTCIELNNITFNEKFNETHKPVLKINPSQYEKLEELEIVFKNNLIFAHGSFNMTKCLNLDVLNLENIIANDLFDISGELNLPPMITKIHIKKCQKRIKNNFNQSEFVTKLNMEKFKHLESLSLSFIKIDHIINLSNVITNLCLKNLKLKFISNIPLSIEHIELNNNLLTEFPNISECLYLIDFNISHNKLLLVPKFINNCLEELNISNNKLKSFPEFEANNLETLILDNNYIVHIPNNLINEKVKFLSLSCNKLTEINILETKKINKLVLSNNKIKKIYKLPEVMTLNLSNNLLEELNLKKIHKANFMKELNVSYNKLTHLNLSQYYRINIVNCSHNLISQLKYDCYRFSFNSLICNNNPLNEINISSPTFDILNIDKTNIKYINLQVQNKLEIENFKYNKKILENHVIESTYFNKKNFIIYNLFADIK